MQNVSDFYLDGAEDIEDAQVGASTNCKCTIKVTKTIGELFGGGVTDFDESILLGYCNDNPHLQNFSKIIDGTDYDMVTAGNGYPYTKNEDFVYGEVEMLGSVLLWGNGKLLGDMYNITEGYGAYKYDYACDVESARIILDVNGNGLNDIILRSSVASGGFDNLRDFDSNIITKIDPGTLIIKDFMTKEKATISNSISCEHIVPYFIVKANGIIIMLSVKDVIFYVYNSNGNFYLDSSNSTYHMSTAPFRTSPMHSYFFGKCLAAEEDTPADETHFGTFRGHNNYKYKHCRTLTEEYSKYVINAIGLKWIFSQEDNVGEAASVVTTVVRLPVMNNNSEIESKNWITGLSNIKTSNSKNKDLSYFNNQSKPTIPLWGWHIRNGHNYK